MPPRISQDDIAIGTPIELRRKKKGKRILYIIFVTTVENCNSIYFL